MIIFFLRLNASFITIIHGLPDFNFLFDPFDGPTFRPSEALCKAPFRDSPEQALAFRPENRRVDNYLTDHLMKKRRGLST
jgi:hypothetical protein